MEGNPYYSGGLKYRQYETGKSGARKGKGADNIRQKNRAPGWIRSVSIGH